MELTSIAANRTVAHQGYTPTPVARAPATRATGQDQPAPAAEAAKAAEQPAKKPDEAMLQEAVDASNKVLASKTSNELHFAIEKGTGLSVVTLINQKSGETILQFPSETMLQIAKGIDQVTGALIQRKA